jgi:small subunit ribosomal protein S4
MIIGPKYKICKRLGSAVFEKCQTQKFSLSEAKAGQRRSKRPGAMSDYKRQLLEKQKMRYTYGISERQLSRYVKESVARGTNPIAELMTRLESRLDNVVYRLGLAKTRRFARQMVSHGHITVNGKKMTVPSHMVKTGDTVAVREGSKDSGMYATLKEDHTAAGVPTWLAFDLKNMSGEAKGTPVYDKAETVFDPQEVLEYYSR